MNAVSESTKNLTGALSNDLFRVVSLQQRGSLAAAERFLQEAKRWANPLRQHKVKNYIIDIATDIDMADVQDISLKKTERYLMYAVLLQNYTLHAQ
jgi:hypothetical protein